ncbi:AEC family transporter [Limnoraphis robusta]|uniref:AEC family transporter n=1 Tax=Limnoraphis robusta CCNP1315 TaxID=3110306 RepID=A0ABU5U4C9_9CYAN|nr:AEC family transporter [Limnoraphis robusta]MEA5521865.1 AEC family transporter [Limnoraphis robusta CCNP1315]MEA5544723.1 AEC family transporter [Limnoraphis robusta CCNP1324]
MTQLLQLYQWLIGGVLLGWILRLILPSFVPVWIGRFLFWVGVPVGIFAFLRQADLSGGIWLAPVVAWIAILSGASLAWVWISRKRHDSHLYLSWSRATQGSFILSSMVGNTGYIGFPIILSLVGTEYFGWAVFYDGLGSAIGAYGLGVLLAAKFGLETQNPLSLMIVMLKNPALWSLGFSLVFREVPFPSGVEQILQVMAWGMVALSLILMGMRLSQLSSLRYLKQASVSLTIKMFIVPLVIGTILSILGVRGSPLLVMVLLMATPPAFATLVLAEAFNLDRELTVTTLAVGSVVLLMTLPFWLFLFGSS